MYMEIRLFSGSANPELARSIARTMDLQLGSAKIGTFSDGETEVIIEDNIRGRDVFLIQPTCAPTNHHLMELLVMVDACRRSSAGRITAVMPYYGYARQDRKVAPRAPITAKLIADLLTTAGVERLLTVDLHAGQIQGFFNIPVDNLYAGPILCRRVRDTLPIENAVVVSPDAGGVERARGYAKRLGAGLAIIDKRRSGPNQSEVLNIIGEVRGKVAIIVDDMIDTAGTLKNAAQAVKEGGAERVFAVATHAVLSGPAAERIGSSVLEKVLVTDTIPLSAAAAACGKIVQVSSAELLGEAIRSIHSNDSVTRLFR